jgi:hypothetical protein
VDLERGSRSPESTIEELLEGESCGFGLEKRDYGRKGSAAQKDGINFADKRQ